MRIHVAFAVLPALAALTGWSRHSTGTYPPPTFARGVEDADAMQHCDDLIAAAADQIHQGALALARVLLRDALRLAEPVRLADAEGRWLLALELHVLTLTAAGRNEEALAATEKALCDLPKERVYDPLRVGLCHRRARVLLLCGRHDEARQAAEGLLPGCRGADGAYTAAAVPILITVANAILAGPDPALQAGRAEPVLHQALAAAPGPVVAASVLLELAVVLRLQNSSEPHAKAVTEALSLLESIPTADDEGREAAFELANYVDACGVTALQGLLRNRIQNLLARFDG